MTSVNTSNNYSSANNSFGAAAGGGVDMSGFWNEVRFNPFLPNIAPLKWTFVIGDWVE